jgi:probable HAF family extracellular repeat protein
MVDLGTLGGNFGRATAVNDFGQVVGASDTASNELRVFMWTSAGGMVDLGTLGGDHSESAAVNDLGQVVGESGGHAFSWTAAGGMVDLGHLGGDTESSAHDVNNLGQVVGTSSNPSEFHAFIWTATGGLVALGPSDRDYSAPYDINDLGQVVGKSCCPERATLWTVNAPVISLTVTLLSTSCAQGSNAPSESFQISNSGGGTLNYSISVDASWLSCNPTSETSTGERDTITVSYTTSGLAAGAYSATITIEAAGASNTPQTIPVSLTVNAETAPGGDGGGGGGGGGCFIETVK